MKKSFASVVIENPKPIYVLTDYTVFIYGVPKIGKTTIACSWPDPIVLATEVRGAKAIQVPRIKIRSWEDFKNAIDLLKKKEQRARFKTAIIDTADLAYKYAFDWTCKHYGFDHPSDQGWGKGWERITDTFLETILELFDLGYCIVFTSHCKTSQVMADWEEYTRIDPTLPNPARKVLLPLVDVIFYMRAKTTKKGVPIRTITTKATREYEAGDRTGCITDLEIRIPAAEKNKAYVLVNSIFTENALKKGD